MLQPHCFWRGCGPQPRQIHPHWFNADPDFSSCGYGSRVLVDDQNFKKITDGKLLLYFLTQNCKLLIPRLLDAQATGEAFSPQKITSSTSKQCSGSESGSTGSTCFWAIRIHLSEVWTRIRLLLSSCKNSKKNLDSYYFVTLFDFLSLENYVNVPSNSNKQKKCFNKNCFLLASWRSMTKKAGSGSISQRHGSPDPDPDPLQNVMDPEHCFKTWNSLLFSIFVDHFCPLGSWIRIHIRIQISGFWRFYLIVSWGIPLGLHRFETKKLLTLPAELPPLIISLGKREHRPITEREILKRVSVSIHRKYWLKCLGYWDTRVELDRCLFNSSQDKTDYNIIGGFLLHLAIPRFSYHTRWWIY